ncbi:MAG: DUF4918 domain-containing protein [Marivirga sp.]|nr:DUF4918 domain-containing protein [Marivirga sp.]
MTFADSVLTFFQQLKITADLPESVEVLNPYHDKLAVELCRRFYKKYYDDDQRRTLILGINPGRHGGGLTGIPFTDPIKLEKFCGISNTLQKKAELSADFMYTMITAFGGPEIFYKQFYFSSVSPLGFTMDGKNLNYYDVKELQINLREFIIQSLKSTISFGINTSVCYCLGEGENFKYLNRLNAELRIFKEIIPLAHPRFIMQYRRKKVNEYVDDYLTKLSR